MLGAISVIRIVRKWKKINNKWFIMATTILFGYIINIKLSVFCDNYLGIIFLADFESSKAGSVQSIEDVWFLDR